MSIAVHVYAFALERANISTQSEYMFQWYSEHLKYSDIKLGKLLALSLEIVGSIVNTSCTLSFAITAALCTCFNNYR